MKCKERELDLELPDYMTKGGPGDNSAPGQIDTSSWFKDQLDRDSWAYNPFVVDKGITSDELSILIKEKGGKDLKSLNLFDVYEGKGIEDNKKSLATSLIWQSSKTTLIDSDIDKVVEKIVNSVKKELDGDLRN